MTIQEIIDAIDAEIKAARADLAKINSLTAVLCVVALPELLDKYVEGLQFARKLVEKAKEVTE